MREPEPEPEYERPIVREPEPEYKHKRTTMRLAENVKEADCESQSGRDCHRELQIDSNGLQILTCDRESAIREAKRQGPSEQ